MLPGHRPPGVPQRLRQRANQPGSLAVGNKIIVHRSRLALLDFPPQPVRLTKTREGHANVQATEVEAAARLERRRLGTRDRHDRRDNRAGRATMGRGA